MCIIVIDNCFGDLIDVLAIKKTLMTVFRVVQFASQIVFKEKFLTQAELAPLGNEQSGLIDFLVLQASTTAVGIGVSTFSFYLQETRLMKGFNPSETALLMLPFIGTDELFFSAAVVAIRTRETLRAQNLLHEQCLRPDRVECFSSKPRGPVVFT